MRWLRLVIFVVIAVGGGLAISAMSQAGTTGARQCGFVRASVPYSHRGNHDRWRVFVRGLATCTDARGVMNAVMHLHATAHNGSSDADSYFSYRGWACDFGQMGSESCVRPRHRPYTAGALAIDCRTAPGGCPARLPADDVPAVARVT